MPVIVLPEPRLTHDAKCLARVEAERDAVHGAHDRLLLAG